MSLLCTKAVLCVASGQGSRWEAFCLDFDIAVQGQSLEEVRELLRDAIEMYVQTADAEPEPNRTRLLARKAPFLVRFMWAWRVFWSTLLIRATRRDGDPATVEFITCPA
jgi:hypothetical protein